ncbi:hypothetical protein Tco_0450135 [Tanacetum coccineum]
MYEPAETLDFALAAQGGRMVEYENLSPQQLPRTCTQEKLISYSASRSLKMSGIFSICDNSKAMARLAQAYFLLIMVGESNPYVGDDDSVLFSTRSLPRPVTWLRSHTKCVIVAVSGVWYRYYIHKSEPHLVLLYIPGPNILRADGQHDFVPAAMAGRILFYSLPALAGLIPCFDKRVLRLFIMRCSDYWFALASLIPCFDKRVLRLFIMRCSDDWFVVWLHLALALILVVMSLARRGVKTEILRILAGKVTALAAMADAEDRSAEPSSAFESSLSCRKTKAGSQETICTAMLTIKSKFVTASMFRVFGEETAELLIVATSEPYKQKIPIEKDKPKWSYK